MAEAFYRYDTVIRSLIRLDFIASFYISPLAVELARWMTANVIVREDELLRGER